MRKPVTVQITNIDCPVNFILDYLPVPTDLNYALDNATVTLHRISAAVSQSQVTGYPTYPKLVSAGFIPTASLTSSQTSYSKVLSSAGSHYQWYVVTDYVEYSSLTTDKVSFSLPMSVADATNSTPFLQLTGNFPNPFNRETKINIMKKEDAKISLKVYNCKGQLVRTVCSGTLSAGGDSMYWDGKDSSSHPAATGFYQYKLESTGQILTGKMLLVK